MDDSVRAEYQRRLDAGDKAGALAYLRMLRTQTDDLATRAAYDAAIDSIEGAGTSATTGQSVGPFGDNPQQWESAHKHRHTHTTAAGSHDTTSSGGSFGTTSEHQAESSTRGLGGEVGHQVGHSANPVTDVSNRITDALHHAVGSVGHALGGLGDQIGAAIGHNAPDAGTRGKIADEDQVVTTRKIADEDVITPSSATERKIADEDGGPTTI